MVIKNNRIEFVPCNFCGIDHSEVLFNSGQLKISRCKKCGLIYTNPRLNQAALDALYNQTYFKSPTPLTLGYEDYIKDYKNITKTFKKRWAEIEKHLTGRSKVLDIGCACGFLLKFLKEKGIETYGVEISEFASRFAREKFGLNVISKPLREIKFPDNFFDVITIWDVIEHFTDPKAEIFEMRRILKPYGILSIITPDAGSFQAKLWGKKWVEYLRPDEHLYFFSRKYLIKLMESIGFKLISDLTAGKYVSLQFILDRLKAYNANVIQFIEIILKFLKLTNKVVYCDPKDKMFLNFQKIS